MIDKQIAQGSASLAIAREIANSADPEVALQDGARVGAARPMVRMSRDRLVHLLELAAQKAINATAAQFHSVDAGRRTLNARFRRGLIRLWCALSSAWIAFIVVSAALNWHGQPGLSEVTFVAIGPPLAVLAATATLIKLGVWVWNGFQGGP